jgi:geranylgeranyl reductase family protein
LAYELAARGLEVLMLEKAALPRYKACGGGLTFKAIRNLPFDVEPIIELDAEGGVVSYKGHQLLKAEVTRPFAWLVMRDRFDHYLVQQAVEAGAHVKDGLAVVGVEERRGRVVARTRGGEFAARFLAGADGVNSVVARSVGLLGRRERGVGIEAEVAVSSAALEAQGAYATFDFGALPHGYGWIFPKRDHLSIGVFRAWHGKAAGLNRYLEAFIESHGVLRGCRFLNQRGHLIPLGGRKESLHRGRVLLVGDAANLADPWLGEGMYYAITSARLAAEVVTDALVDGAVDLGGYTARINAGMVHQMRHGRHLANLVYRLPRLCTTLLSGSPLMQEFAFGTIRGDRTFQQFNRDMALWLPRIVIQALFRKHPEQVRDSSAI